MHPCCFSLLNDLRLNFYFLMLHLLLAYYLFFLTFKCLLFRLPPTTSWWTRIFSLIVSSWQEIAMHNVGLAKDLPYGTVNTRGARVVGKE